MARPENEAKTALGNRLRSVRKAVGDPDRSAFAKSIGVSKNSLAAYERGENEPTASTLAAYASTYGICLQWLITGESEMFSSVQFGLQSACILDKDVMKIAIEAVEEGLGERRYPADKKATLILLGYDLILKDKSNRINVVEFARAI
ncbi:MAG: helix-turn-helix domain-containing protein [Commensalibacter sp.]|nr:helix-turn-helix domain-containing protein [Commensalibacter sp.]